VLEHVLIALMIVWPASAAIHITIGVRPPLAVFVGFVYAALYLGIAYILRDEESF